MIKDLLFDLLFLIVFLFLNKKQREGKNQNDIVFEMAFYKIFDRQ
jgi:hypothetical protein